MAEGELQGIAATAGLAQQPDHEPLVLGHRLVRGHVQRDLRFEPGEEEMNGVQTGDPDCDRDQSATSPGCSARRWSCRCSSASRTAASTRFAAESFDGCRRAAPPSSSLPNADVSRSNAPDADRRGPGRGRNGRHGRLDSMDRRAAGPSREAPGAGPGRRGGDIDIDLRGVRCSPTTAIHSTNHCTDWWGRCAQSRVRRRRQTGRTSTQMRTSMAVGGTRVGHAAPRRAGDGALVAAGPGSASRAVLRACTRTSNRAGPGFELRVRCSGQARPAGRSFARSRCFDPNRCVGRAGRYPAPGHRHPRAGRRP
jgi:hypothetical protein